VGAEEAEHLVDRGAARLRRRDRLAPGLQEISDIDALAFDQPLPLVFALIGVGWKGACEPLELRWLRCNARIVQNDRLHAEQRARMKGIIEYRDRDATLVDPTAVETHPHAGPRLRRRSTRARMRVTDG
jgi:hypothetical protein